MNTDTKKNIKKIVIGVLFTAIILYGFFGFKDVIEGVNLTITGIEDGATYEEPVLELSGTAKNATYLSINNRDIAVSQEGTFTDVIVLVPGYNIITVKAQDKFKKEVTEEYRVFLDDDPLNYPIPNFEEEPQEINTQTEEVTPPPETNEEIQ